MVMGGHWVRCPLEHLLSWAGTSATHRKKNNLEKEMMNYSLDKLTLCIHQVIWKVGGCSGLHVNYAFQETF